MNTLPVRTMKQWPLAAAVLVLVAALPFAAACAKAKPLTVSFEGKGDMNGGFSCLVCIYQLRKETGFMSVPLDVFWGSAPPPFQSDLVEPRMEVMLDPGETQKNIKLKLSKETRFIGAAADFRRPDGNSWRKILPLSPKKGPLPASMRKGRYIVLTVSAGGIDFKN